jgi:hypothetical protein
MSQWEISITLKSIHNGELVEKLETQKFDTRIEAERFLITHPLWENHFVFPVAELKHSIAGTFFLDPTNWNHIHQQGK